MTDATDVRKRSVILVVDDDATIRLILRRGLEKEGYSVIEAENGMQALSVCEEQRPDLVVMDCMMPVMDGFTACTRLQSTPACGFTPVLMLTGLEDYNSMEMAVQAGAVDFVSKPVNWTVLNQRVGRILRARTTEMLLDRSQSSAQSIIENALDGILTIDAGGGIKSFNPAAESIFDYGAAEVMGKNVDLLMDGVSRKDDRVGAGTGGKEQKAFNASREITGKRRDGSRFPVQLTISGFQGGDRLLTVRDISERKDAEKKLSMAASVFENVSEAIMITSPEGVLQMVNPAFSVITGYSAEEAVGSNQSVLMSDRHHHQMYKKAVVKKGYWEGEVWSRRKNGEVFPLRLSTSTINDDNGRIVQLVHVFSDITEQLKLAEEKMRLQEQAARSQKLASLGTMSAGITHEINQPLHSIKVIVDGMLYWHRRGRALEAEKLFENLKKISGQVGRIGEIIKHMRSFVNAGGETGRLLPCNLNDAVDGTLGLLGRQMAAHGIEVNTVLTHDLPMVRANATRLEEVVVNLLVNAMHAFDGVSLTNKEVFCSTFSESGRVVLEVSDNATGISDEIMDRIFDPFFSTKAGGDGMGLGLSIVQSIVCTYGGEARASNNEQGGATFRIELPALTTDSPGGWIR